MFNRRFFMQAAVGGLLLPALGGVSFGAPTAAAPAKTKLTADQALALLKQGNAAFVSGAAAKAPGPRSGPRKRRLEIAQSQAPFAVYISCSDSRVPPELLFGRGLGELFIIRNAGNTVDTVAMGSIEYAVAELGVPLIVVMGHERCGAVKAALAVVESNAVFPGSIGRMIEPIVPAVLRARQRGGDLLDASVRENVRRVTADLRVASEPMLLDPQRLGVLKVVGAHYDLDTGVVDFFDEPPSPNKP